MYEEDLALNNQHELICHNKPTNQRYPSLSVCLSLSHSLSLYDYLSLLLSLLSLSLSLSISSYLSLFFYSINFVQGEKYLSHLKAFEER